ncbi:MAG: translocation/assembly module TamB [Prevotellaceae bacterium]|jgi:hypothetical protein|nr:translocation/assembly module TamB [Prevotellaceae bacterium]
MLKTIKGILQILLLLAILLPATAYFMLRLPPIQTYIIQKITNEISQITKTKVSIKSVNYKFFKSLVLEDFYIEDTEGDTLTSISRVEMSLENIWFSQKKINFSSVILADGQFNLITTNDTLNLDKLLSRLSTNTAAADTAKSEGYSISTKQFKLKNFRFSLQNKDDTEVGIPEQINFSNLRVDSINLTANNIKFVSDTIFFDISDFSFREKSGFHVIAITTGKNAYVCSHRAYLPSLSIIDDYTNLKFEYYAMNFPNGGDDINDYLNRVRMEANIDGGYVAFKTIGFFANDLLKNSIVVFPRGLVNGTVANMNTKNFSITSASGFTSLSGNFSFAGLPELDTTVFKCNNLKVFTNIKDINATVKQITHSAENVLGSEFEQIKSINFSGELSGFYNNFLMKGLLNTNLGAINTDTKFDFSSPKNDFEIIGNLILDNFNLGKFVGVEIIENVSLNIDMRSVQTKDKDFSLYAEGKISDVMFNERNYKNIDVAGTLFNNAFDGRVTSNDESLKFDFLGRIDMNKTNIDDYRFNFTSNITYADLYKLKLKTDDTTSVFSGKIAAELRGKSINFNGNIKLQNAKYQNSQNIIDIGGIQLQATQTNNNYKISLLSSYFDAVYKGNMNIENFISDAKYFISKYIPDIYENTNSEPDKNADYELNIITKRSQNFLQILYPDFFIAENTNINLKINGNKANINAKSNFINFDNLMLRNLNLSADADSIFTFNTNCEEVIFEGFNFKNLLINGNAKNNKISSLIKYDNKTNITNKGNINLQTQILKDIEGKTYFKFIIDSSQIIINNAAWNFVSKNVKIQKDYFEVSKFEAVCDSQKIMIDGIYSTLSSDTMRFEFTNFDIANFNPIFENEGYKLEGKILAIARITNVDGNTMFFSNIQTTDIRANDWLLGKISVRSRWKDDTQNIEFISRLTKNDDEKLNVRGLYTPNKDYYDLTFDAKNFELKIAEALIDDEINEVEGNITGTLNLKGVGGKLNLLGNANLDSVGFTVDFLKTHYMLSTPVTFDENKIQIQNATLLDEQSNKGRLNVAVNHKNLRDFAFDINLNAEKLLGLNTTQRDNEEFYGKAYITGLVRMNGRLDNLNFNIDIHPEKNTQIIIPINSASISEKTLLTFENNDSVAELNYIERFIAKKQKEKEENTTPSALDISLTITMNNNAEVKLLLDENSGDALTVTGSGALRMSINPRQEKFKLNGNYIIENGNFKWTLPMLNFVSKEFNINNGSQINFNGDIDKTTVNITADYAHQFRLPLRNLLSDTTISNAQYPVICSLQLTDNISNFKIRPLIDIQNIDVDTKARAQAMLNTDEKLWRQFSGLLVMRDFIPDEQAGNFISSASLMSNLSEIFSNQLSAWLASIKVPVDVGVDIRTGTATTDTEVSTHASLMLFDDRVKIYGSVGSAPRTSTSDVAGDFDVDIKLNNTGSQKLKVFSHSTDEYTDESETSRQGVKMSYQGGFNTWKELWNSIFRPKRARERRERIRQRQTAVQDSIKNEELRVNEE